jgi:hypothetical protein
MSTIYGDQHRPLKELLARSDNNKSFRSASLATIDCTSKPFLGADCFRLRAVRVRVDWHQPTLWTPFDRVSRLPGEALSSRESKLAGTSMHGPVELLEENWGE